MKFGKEFASQMVPEWQEAYMDYEFLKNLLKQIQTFKRKNNPQPGPTRTRTLHRAFSGLLNHKVPPDSSETPVIVVHNTNHGSETMFLMAADEGGEYGLVYFKKLDSEFNKAVNFYKDKVDQVMEEAAVLNKQMQAFIAFRAKVEDLGPNPNEPNKTNNNLDEESSKLASEVAASRAALASTTPAITSRSVRMDVIDEGSSTDRGELSSEDMKSGGYGDDGWEMRPINSNNVNIIQESNKKKRTINSNNNKMAPLDVLARVKFNNTIETPRSTIKGFLNIPSQTELKFTRDNLKKAEQQLKEAFVVFYHKLRLLKSYSFLNLMAFSKIMKKYDKIASRSASKSYMKMVDNSYLGSSDEVSKLMERVEVIFIKHFSNSNRSKGMTILRPRKKRERHRVTFSMGFLVGCTISLILALVLVIRARHIISSAGTVLYMETMFPLYSLFGFIVLHMLMYAANIYFWRRFRVNYSFIFGFKEGSQLGYRQILLMSFCLSGLALASVLANLDMEMDPETKDYKAITELLPLGLVVLVVLIVLCPLNILYRSSRFFLLGCLFHCILAPLYKVTLPDFFIADQLTSQVQALRSLEFYICYYGWGDYKRRQNSCRSSDVFKTFSYIVAAIPYGWRFFQCLRRLVDEKDRMQGYNGLKYLSTIIAVCARTAYTLNRGPAWKLVAWIASIIATIVSTYWDIVIDWGLFQRNSKNRWLRDKLLVPHTSVYFAAIILNALLRLAWMQTVIGVRIFSIHRQTMTALVASLEIIRRGLWNFFRLENEHLNNVGKYRAFKSVPLPFNYDEDGHKED